jgi:hypothetical protein
VFDESIQNDAICIQEIVPWANLQTIYSILKKFSDSSNRKQLTLWELMRKESNCTSPTISKHKQNSDICTILKKSPKLETSDYIDEPFDLAPYLQANTLYNESSNDTQSSRISEFNLEVTDKNQNDQIPEDNNSIKVMFLNKTELKNPDNISVVSSECVDNKTTHIVLDESADLMSLNVKEHQFYDNLKNSSSHKITNNSILMFANRSIKKEKNETVVSGSLNEHYVTPPIDEIASRNNIFPLNSSNFVKERSAKTVDLSNRYDKQCKNIFNENLQKNENNISILNKIQNETVKVFSKGNSSLKTGKIKN